DSGFFPYERQTLYRLAEKGPVVEPGLPLRVRTKEDLHGIYQLYNRVAPANVRGIEGATFREWQAALEPWGGRPHEFVFEEHGAIMGWLRVLSGPVARIGVMAAGASSVSEDLMRAGLSQVNTGGPVLCLAGEHDLGLRRALESLGFEPDGTYLMMAKRLAKVARELVPETAGTAVPVN
ncbi:MAG TPA: hypothetical protein VLS25_12110, partial [Dehalococcoidia bacterium]|nr:hypothetical protein [Dehalococcoidia bacterium]